MMGQPSHYIPCSCILLNGKRFSQGNVSPVHVWKWFSQAFSNFFLGGRIKTLNWWAALNSLILLFYFFFCFIPLSKHGKHMPRGPRLPPFLPLFFSTVSPVRIQCATCLFLLYIDRSVCRVFRQGRLSNQSFVLKQCNICLNI